MNATKALLLILAFAFVAVAVIVVVVVAFAWFGTERVPRGTLLEVDLEQTHVEYVASDPISQAFFPRIPQVRDTVDALARAAEDDKVVGLIARVGPAGNGIERTTPGSNRRESDSPGSRRSATPSSPFATPESSPWPTPRRSASSGLETGPTISPPPSTRSICSRRETLVSPA